MSQPKPRPDWHRLTDVDRSEKTGVCSICGPVAVRTRTSGGAECAVKASSRDSDGRRVQRRREWTKAASRRPEIFLRVSARVEGWDPATLSVEGYKAMLAAQNGVCAICLGVDIDRRLAIDHDHETGVVRGLLCLGCNRLLGRFKDDPALFERAAAYLRRSA